MGGKSVHVAEELCDAEGLDETLGVDDAEAEGLDVTLGVSEGEGVKEIDAVDVGVGCAHSWTWMFEVSAGQVGQPPCPPEESQVDCQG
jgi:hypothetical protein